VILKTDRHRTDQLRMRQPASLQVSPSRPNHVGACGTVIAGVRCGTAPAEVGVWIAVTKLGLISIRVGCGWTTVKAAPLQAVQPAAFTPSHVGCAFQAWREATRAAVPARRRAAGRSAIEHLRFVLSQASSPSPGISAYAGGLGLESGRLSQPPPGAASGLLDRLAGSRLAGIGLTLRSRPATAKSSWGSD